MISYTIDMLARCDGCGREFGRRRLHDPSNIDGTERDFKTMIAGDGGEVRKRKQNQPLMFCTGCVQKAKNERR